MPDSTDPSLEVWTTMAYDGNKSLLAPYLHFNRLLKHSQILGIDVNVDLSKIVFEELGKMPNIEDYNKLNEEIPFLVKLKVNREGIISLEMRKNNLWTDNPLQAISMMAPDFELPILGTKHGDWQTYENAREQAINHNSDIALFFKDNFLIDGDHCMPLMLDNDGIAYHPKHSDGALDSITLEQLREDMELLGIPIRGAKISLKMLLRASELIVLGSGMGVCSVGTIDGTKIGMPKGKLYEIAREVWLNKLKNGWSNLR